jgi:hypothetical protein
MADEGHLGDVRVPAYELSQLDECLTVLSADRPLTPAGRHNADGEGLERVQSPAHGGEMGPCQRFSECP